MNCVWHTLLCTLTLFVIFDALLLWFDIEYLLDAFDDEEKQGEDRVLDTDVTDVSVTLVAQFRLSLFAVGVGDDVEYLLEIDEFNGFSIDLIRFIF